MRLLAAGLAALNLVIAGPALASDKKATNDKKDRMVCKSQTMINSRFEKRVCRPASEWAELAERHKDALQEQMSRPVINRQGEAPDAGL